MNNNKKIYILNLKEFVIKILQEYISNEYDNIFNNNDIIEIKEI